MRWRNVKFTSNNRSRNDIQGYERETEKNPQTRTRRSETQKQGGEVIVTMYELTTDYMAVLNMALDPDVPPEAIADTLEAIGGEIEIKAESSAVIMQELNAEIEKLKAEEKRLEARRKQFETNAAAIKDRIYNAMKLTGKEKFKTTLFSFSIGKNPAKLVIDDETKIPKKYLIPQPAKIDNAAIKEFLKGGKSCKYAHLEQGESLKIK